MTVLLQIRFKAVAIGFRNPDNAWNLQEISAHIPPGFIVGYRNLVKPGYVVTCRSDRHNKSRIPLFERNQLKRAVHTAFTYGIFLYLPVLVLIGKAVTWNIAVK